MKTDLIYTVHIDPDKVENVLSSFALDGYYPTPDNNSYSDDGDRTRKVERFSLAASDTFYVDLHNALVVGLIHSFHCQFAEAW